MKKKTLKKVAFQKSAPQKIPDPQAKKSSQWVSFEVITPGKWVLSGEHTVLRGGEAIALPHPEFKLSFSFEPSSEPLSVIPDLASVATQDLLRTAREWLKGQGIEMVWPQGEIILESTIPFGAGLGSSAAFSVAMARWILSAHQMPSQFEIPLAQVFENRFHGVSSGMDVSVVSIGKPILFSMKKGAQILPINHLPSFVFKDTGIRASTKDCIEKVEMLALKNPKKAKELDQKMSVATDRILKALRLFDEGFKKRRDENQCMEALDQIAQEMVHSREVFEEWGLNPPEFTDFLQLEKSSGKAEDPASIHGYSFRLTGAGSGGFMVGLTKSLELGNKN